MQQAPEIPSTEMLRQIHTLSGQAANAITEKRLAISEAFEYPETHLVAMPGYCARPGKKDTNLILREGQQIAQLEYRTDNLVTAHRGPTWKPRSDPEDWHGEEVSDPEGAFYTVTRESEMLGNVAMEIGYTEQLQRYASRLVLIWAGGRNVANDLLIEQMALQDPSIPMGVKNGLDGDIGLALKQVERANNLRSPGDAPVFLIFRGGDNAKTSERWADEYKSALAATAGRLMVDTAHGSEMAHDPSGAYKKSQEGQEAAAYHVLGLARQGLLPAGITLEASDWVGPTDPNMRLGIALSVISELQTIKSQYNSLALAA